MDWVRLSSAIERNRTPHIQWVRFPNKSNSIEQIELNRTQSVWLSSIEFGNRTQSNTIKWISFDWLWWIYTKRALSKPVKASFSRAFFTIYSITQTPFINCPRQLREQNRTKQSYHYSIKRIIKRTEQNKTKLSISGIEYTCENFITLGIHENKTTLDKNWQKGFIM